MELGDAARVVDRFGLGFMGKSPAAVEKDRFRSQLNISWNWIDTKEVSKLGVGTEDETVQYQEVHFIQELPFQVEIGLRASLMMLEKNISSFGGFARWGFFDRPYARLSLVAHGSSANFRSLMGVNFYGTLLEADIFFRSFILTAGLGNLRSTASFKAQIFNQGGVPLTGQQPDVRVSRNYSHQMFRLTYITGRWSLSAQSDSLKEIYNSFLLGYLF